MNEADAANFRKLLCLLVEEHPVFQSHVLDFVRDAIKEIETHAERMARLHSSFPAQDLEAFITALPPARGTVAQPGPLGELLGLTQDLSNSQVPPADIAALIAGELLHRKAWEEVLARYPGTLTVLKERLTS